MKRKQAIILASGGLDSYVLANYISRKYKARKILFFNYRQKCLKQELFCVRKLARKINARLEIIDLKWLGEISTSLINKNKKTGKEELINWYVPFRNAIFLAVALSYAESEFISRGIKSDIFIGIKQEGEIRFNDTKPEFLDVMNKLAGFSQKGKFKIKAPFINMEKEDIIELGKKMILKLEETYSCYFGGNSGKLVHCGKCAGCLARKKGFRFSKVEDKSAYA